MKTGKAIEKEKLVRCCDCANYPNSCGYYPDSKIKLHTCPDKGYGQHGFKPAENMSLKDTIYNLEMHIKGSDRSARLLRRVLHYLKRDGKYEAIVKDIEKDFNDLHCNFFSEHAFNLIKQKHFPKPEKKVIK